MAAPAETEANLTRNEKIFFGISLGLFVIGLLHFPDLIGITGVGIALAVITQASRHHRQNSTEGTGTDLLF